MLKNGNYLIKHWKKLSRIRLNGFLEHFRRRSRKTIQIRIKKIGDGRYKSMIEHTSKLLKLSKKEIRELESIVKKRNNIAHNGFTSISWNNVDLVLKVALKLNMK